MNWTEEELLEKLNFVLSDVREAIAVRLKDEAERQRGKVLWDTWNDSLAKYLSMSITKCPRKEL